MKSTFLVLLTSLCFANEFDPVKFSVSNSGIYQETNIYNDILGSTKARSLDHYTNTYRTNSFEIEAEKKISINKLNNLFLFIKAKGASQVGKHSDPYVEFYELNNEVQRNLKADFSATIIKQFKNHFYGFGFNEVEIDKVWYMYRDQVSDDKDYINETSIKSSINIGPSYGIVYDGSDHYFFVKGSTGYVVVRDDILDDQQFVNFTVEAEYSYLDTYGLYGSYKVNLNSDVVETSYDAGMYLKAAEFKVLNSDMDVRFKIGMKKTQRDTSQYELDDTQFYIGLELKF